VFNRSAQWYDAFYAGIDYDAEAEVVTAIIRRQNPQAASLLDVACGTGRHLESFGRHFECAGVDIEREMVAIARKRLPDIPLRTADMVGLDLGRKFDAITCLFSSIGYTAQPDRLDAAVRAMARHLHPGGVLVVEPWITPDTWVGEGRDTVEVIDHGGGKLVRIISSRREGDESMLCMRYAFAAGGHIATEQEHHRLGLFTEKRYVAAFTSAGLRATWHHPGLRGRGLLVAV
jgi:SAM-dependent methyltransferase